MFRYIRAMSYSKKQIESKLEEHSNQLDKHIMKLMMFPSSKNASHWKQEIYNFLNEVPKLRGSNKFPNDRFIFNCISRHEDQLDSYYRQLCSDHYPDFVKSSALPSEIENGVHMYHRWIAEMLSRYGVVTRNEVYEFLDNILQGATNV